MGEAHLAVTNYSHLNYMTENKMASVQVVDCRPALIIGPVAGKDAILTSKPNLKSFKVHIQKVRSKT